MTQTATAFTAPGSGVAGQELGIHYCAVVLALPR
jgi:hypothetical protein